MRESFLYALPQGWEVQHGYADFNQPNSTTLNVSTSDKVIINYQSFSIAQPEAVNFYQPGAESVALNRVVGVNPSEIFGRLTARGKIFLVNPNGILFGPNSYVDVAGLVASTLNISNEAFLNGNYTFNKYADKIGASVINQGYIQAKSAVLMGSQVKNEGKIITTLGKTTLASGEKATLSLDTAGMISVAIDEPVKEKVLKDSKEIKSGVDNQGEIKADGGVVVLTAKALDNIFDYAVNNEGIICANAINTHSGRVELVANQRVNIGGEIDARGGEVRVDSQGGDFSGNINASQGKYNMNRQDTTINGGLYSGDQTWEDKGNINLKGDLTVNGNVTFTADSDNDGSGDFTQDFGLIESRGNSADITISGYNVTVRAIDSGGGLSISANNQLTFAQPWEYKAQIELANNSGTALTDFQVQLNIQKQDSMNSDYSDIRFVDSNGRPLNYWIETYNSNSVTLWVKIPSIPASGTTLYMYYGNSSASSESSLSNTFIREINGVIGAWNLDEGTGSIANDTSGNDNDGTLTGAGGNPPPTWVEGKIGKGLYFDGQDDFVYIQNSSELNPQSEISVEFWTKISDLGDWSRLLAKGTSPGSRQYFFISSSGYNILKFSVIIAGNEYSTPDWSNPTLNEWVHLVGRYDGSEISLWVNGSKQGSNSLSGSIDTGSGPLIFGVEDNTGNFFEGYLDEIRIYNRALVENEIQDLYNYRGYSSENYPGKVLVRKLASVEPSLISINYGTSAKKFEADGTIVLRGDKSITFNSANSLIRASEGINITVNNGSIFAQGISTHLHAGSDSTFSASNGIIGSLSGQPSSNYGALKVEVDSGNLTLNIGSTLSSSEGSIGKKGVSGNLTSTTLSQDRIIFSPFSFSSLYPPGYVFLNLQEVWPFTPNEEFRRYANLEEQMHEIFNPLSIAATLEGYRFYPLGFGRILRYSRSPLAEIDFSHLFKEINNSLFLRNCKIDLW